MQTFSEWFRGVREGRKQTQADVAKELKISIPTVSRWEAGTEPRPSLLQKIAKWGGIEPSKLLAMFR